MARPPILIGAILLALLALPVRAEDFTSLRLWEPGVEVRVLTTPHFRIYHGAPWAAEASDLARLAEQEHARLTRWLPLDTKDPTEVVLLDGVDVTNSYAETSVGPRMGIFLKPPTADLYAEMPLAWPRGVFVHEYTHVLQGLRHHQTSELGWLNLFFGYQQLFTSFQSQRSSLMEGLAVYAETAFTPQGRDRAGLADPTLRMIALQGVLPDLSQVDPASTRYPLGNGSYLYGGAFFRWLAETRGPEATAHWVGEASRRVLSGADAAVTAVWPDMPGMAALWEAFRSDLRARAEAEAAPLRSQGLITGTEQFRLTGRIEGPRWLPDGAIACAQEPVGDRPGVRTLAGTFLAPLMGPFSVARDGTLIFALTQQVDAWRQQSDLFERRPGGEIHQVTHGMRLELPDVRSDGARVAAVRYAGHGRYELVILDRAYRVLQTLPTPPGVSAAFGQPRWSPDGRRLAVALVTDGHCDLAIVDVATGRIERLWEDEAIDHMPDWSSDGRYLLFSSQRGPAFDLHAADLVQRKLYRVTRVLGAALAPAVAGDQVAFLHLEGDGMSVHTLPLRPETWTEVPWPQGGPAPYQGLATNAVPEVGVSTPLEAPVAGGIPWLEAMRPRFWFPFVEQDAAGFYPTLHTLSISPMWHPDLALNVGYGRRLHYDAALRTLLGPLDWELQASQRDTGLVLGLVDASGSLLPDPWYDTSSETSRWSYGTGVRYLGELPWRGLLGLSLGHDLNLALAGAPGFMPTGHFARAGADLTLDALQLDPASPGPHRGWLIYGAYDYLAGLERQGDGSRAQVGAVLPLAGAGTFASWLKAEGFWSSHGQPRTLGYALVLDSGQVDAPLRGLYVQATQGLNMNVTAAQAFPVENQAHLAGLDLWLGSVTLRGFWDQAVTGPAFGSPGGYHSSLGVLLELPVEIRTLLPGRLALQLGLAAPFAYESQFFTPEPGLLVQLSTNGGGRRTLDAHRR